MNQTNPGGSMPPAPLDYPRVGADPAEPLSMRASHVFMLAAWFGLATGIGAAGLEGVKKFLLGHVTLITPQVVWTSPVTFLIGSIPVALLLLGLVRMFPRFVDLKAVVFLLASTSAACGLLIWGAELHGVSVILLSLGIAVQMAALAKRRPDTALRLARRSLPVLGGVVVLMAALLNAGGRILEWRAVAGLRPAPADAPNVLLIILDTVRSANLSLQGYFRPTTPQLERFAAGGVTFDMAIAPAPWTLPSHATIFTGRHSAELSAGWTNPLDGSFPTLAEHLRDRGYRTGGMVGNVFYVNSEWGLARGFNHYSDYTASLGHALLSTFPGRWLIDRLEAARLDREFWFHRINGRRIAPQVSAGLVRWLERDRERPYFAFVNYYDAHDPYVAPAPFIERMATLPQRDSLPLKALQAGSLVDLPPERRPAALARIDRYDAAIAYLDDQLGNVLTDLEQRGLLENTVVIVTSDHGEEFRETGHVWHGESLHLTALRVPLVVHFPDRVPTGMRVPETVSLRDLPATIIDLLALDADAPFPGASLARYWNGSSAPNGSPAPPSEPAFSSLTLREARVLTGEQTFHSVVTDGMHYIRSDLGREELFDIKADPWEQIDRAEGDTLALLPWRARLRQTPAGSRL